MNTALIVTNSIKSYDSLNSLLRSSFIDVQLAKNCNLARNIMQKRQFDLVIINSPLTDETGEDLACQAIKSSQVIFITNSEAFDVLSNSLEKLGILIILKPINKDILRQAISLIKSINTSLIRAKNENALLKQKIEDIKIIDRAKFVLMSFCNMTESEAHRFIEKKAMDTRTLRRIVAEQVISSYENPKNGNDVK